jgi:hypothetical protein
LLASGKLMIDKRFINRYASRYTVHKNGQPWTMGLTRCEKSHGSVYLAGFTNFISSNARGTNPDGFMRPIRHYHMATLQVGLLKKPMMLIGKADFVGFVAAFPAGFTDGHGENSFIGCSLEV